MKKKKIVLLRFLLYVFAIITVLCTAPSRYSVVDSEGVIKPRCCIDMYVRDFIGNCICTLFKAS